MQRHNGFNLIVGDLVTNQVAYMTNRGDRPRNPLILQGGMHAISNNTLHDDTWPKAKLSIELLQVLFCLQLLVTCHNTTFIASNNVQMCKPI
jgi:uncharacterized protein with NRDE domain